MGRWILAVALLVGACGSDNQSLPLADAGADSAVAVPDGPGAADLSTVGDVVPVDAAPADSLAAADTTLADTAVVGDGPRASGTRFVLRNETGKTIYLQDNAFWSLWRGSQLLRPSDTCEYCNCDAAGCAVCGKALDMTIAIAPGAAQTWEWNGANWTLQQRATLPMGIQCEQPEPVTPGPLQVRVIYSLSKVDEPPESHIGPAIVVPLDFQHPPSADVVLVVR